MQIDVDPPLEPVLVEALRPLVLEMLRSNDRPHPALASAWRRAAACESVENDLLRPRYALSPRSTRGATRA